jgi:MFS family permease
MDVIGVASELQRAASLAARGSAAEQRAHRVALLSVVTPAKFHPTANVLPGGSTLLALINGIAGWAVLLALAGLVIGAALWAIGSHSQNYQQSYVGRRAVLVSGIAALLIGAAPTLINFFFNTGHHIVNPLPQ